MRCGIFFLEERRGTLFSLWLSCPVDNLYSPCSHITPPVFLQFMFISRQQPQLVFLPVPFPLLIFPSFETYSNHFLLHNDVSLNIFFFKTFCNNLLRINLFILMAQTAHNSSIAAHDLCCSRAFSSYILLQCTLLLVFIRDFCD